MAYEKVKLVVAGMNGEIYLTRILKDGVMSDSRRVATEDCLRATTEWFMANKKTMISYGHVKENVVPHLFYTDDPEKAKEILKILKPNKEGNNEKDN